MKRSILIFFFLLTCRLMMAQCPLPYPADGINSVMCEGGPAKTITLFSSQIGVSYQLRRGGANIGAPLPGTGQGLQWPGITTAGTYDVVATNPVSGCVQTMPWSGPKTLVVRPLPLEFTVSGGGSFCNDQTATITLSGSQAGTSYVLFWNGSSVGAVESGTGQALSWNVTASGTYTVYANLNGCGRFMAGQGIVNNTSLTQFAVSGTRVVCPGVAETITLIGSQTAVQYQLKRDGVNVGQPINGTGGQLAWNQQPVGVYTVVATSAGGSCSREMSGSATISTVTAPAEFILSGQDFVCTGLSLTLSGSETGRSYELYTPGYASQLVAGTGNSITWNDLPRSGQYQVNVRYTNGYLTCISTMASKKTVEQIMSIGINGGGYLCPDGQSKTLTLLDSQVGLEYQLKRDGQNDGAPVAGTGESLTWENKSAPGTYTVVATYPALACTRTMSGSTTITIPVIENFSVSLQKTGPNCGENLIRIDGTQQNVTYKLKRNGIPVTVGTPGGPAQLAWNYIFSSGRYTVEANHLASGCLVQMPGYADITCDFDQLTAVQNMRISTDSLPSEYRLAVGGKILTAGINLKAPYDWPDYVFENDYPLASIEDLETYITANRHLPNVPSAGEMKKQEFYGAGVLDKVLLEKIEELTLYTLDIHDQASGIEQSGRKIEAAGHPSNSHFAAGKKKEDTGSLQRSIASASPSFQPGFDQDFPGVNIKKTLSIGRSGEVPAGVKLMVEGNILAGGLDIKATDNWPDYVFSKQYDLMPLKAVKGFVGQHGHLPGLQSAKQVKDAGHYDCSEIDAKLLEKVEELTLYVIDLQNRINQADAKGQRSPRRNPVAAQPDSEVAATSLKSEPFRVVRGAPHPLDQNILQFDDAKPLTALESIDDLQVVTVGGTVTVGTSTIVPDYKLVVAGNIIATGAKFKPPHKWPDYVFTPGYELLTLDELRSFVEEKRHLPGIRSAADMNNAGDYNLAEMDGKLLEKIEELTLYLIQLQERIERIQESSKE